MLDLSIFDRYRDVLDIEAIKDLQLQRMEALEREAWATIRNNLRRLPDRKSLLSLKENIENCGVNPVVKIGTNTAISAQERELFESAIVALKPWRKGPFEIFGIEVDAEWRSDYKWSRIEPFLGDLTGKRVADIGCGNGYYMFRALSKNPECIIGFDPYELFYFCYHLIQRYLEDPRLSFELFGVEQIILFPEFFDVVLCMGIIYHQKNPIDMLKSIHTSMRPGGVLILETQGIPGNTSVALFPEDRYAQMRNVYFVPTAECLRSLALRAGFRDVETISNVRLTTDEQRSTKYGSVQSLKDYLDPEDSSKTVEGYPAPLRIALRAYK